MKSLKTFKALSLLAVFVIGRCALARLLSSSGPVAKPQNLPTTQTCLLRCPSGNILHVEFDGLPDSQPLVLIHGLNSNSNQWFYQRQAFKDKYRLIFIDLPGHGRSAMPKDLSIAAIAEDLAYILDYFKIHQPILYGHSMGAMAVMKYCINHQDADIKGIVIQHSTHTNVLTTCSLAPVLVPLQRSVIVPFLKFSFKNHYLIWLISMFNHLNGLGLLFFRFVYFTGRQTAAQLNFKSKIAAFTSPKTVAWALLELVKLNLTDDLKKINAPALVLAAYNDRLTDLEANRFISSQIPDAQLRYVQTGHLSIIENYKQVNQAVQRFIAGLS